MTLCPVVGYELDCTPWHGESPSDEICPSCGIQFGYDDACPETRTGVYAAWRTRWMAAGMRWWSSRPPPASWDPAVQLVLVRP